MPIISVSLTAGRNETVKAFIARGVVDSVAEFAAVSPDGIHVLFTDLERQAWAFGPRLLSESQPRPPAVRSMPYLHIANVDVARGRRDDYLDWRRTRLQPQLARTEGFLSTSVVLPEDADDRLVVLERWRTEQARQDFLSGYGELLDEAADMAGPARTLASGTVADTWGSPAR